MNTYFGLNEFNFANPLTAVTSRESILELRNLNFYVFCGILLKLKKLLTVR